MNENVDLRKISPKAFQLLLEEAQSSTRETRDLLESITSSTVQDYRDAGLLFHRLKGGAGFFALHDLTKVAADLEVTFQNAVCQDDINVEKVERHLEFIEQRVIELRKESVNEKTTGSD